MLYHLLYPLKELFSPFNIFYYITFRSGGAIITAMIICFMAGPYIIRIMQNRQWGQQVRSDGPSTHLSKQGTPTMGGLMIVCSFLVSTLLWARLDNPFIIILVVASIVLGALGFMDDYLKLSDKNSKGLSARTKLLGQTLVAAGVAGYISQFPPNYRFHMYVNIPYLKDAYVYLSLFYFLFVILVIVGSSNGVNLTDGQDGLAIGGIIFATVTYMILAYLAGNFKFSDYLRIIYVPGAGEITVFLAALLGASVGFLWYNAYPADIFMGDSGSLVLGGLLGIVAVLIRQEVLLLVVGGVFVVEVLSVMMQVGSYKLRKKRIFRMAPLHHHFELGGLKEPKVTVRFWIISMILSLLALASLKVR